MKQISEYIDIFLFISGFTIGVSLLAVSFFSVYLKRKAYKLITSFMTGE